MTSRALIFFSIAVFLAPCAAAESVPTAIPLPKVPPGFSIELAAGPPIVERPIVASFDNEGRLYVAESSGSNDKVQEQLEKKPHRIVCLQDTNGDGKFDKRTVFADHMMFPEGCLWFDGSVYVSAPPSIWKLTDTDGDGVADKREEWFKGGTLTGCANDLHGPYAGPDGFIYWCKGAFAEQTHMVNGKEWKTKAAHIFRCRPDGTGFEPVMTGGMDNPVDVAFMPDGERILSGTFFHVNPRNDGLIHAIYGGVYGKDHGVLDGHPRTGELMPLLDPLTAVAGCGLERYDSDVFGADYRDNLFLCQFNLRKVSRHILKPSGSTYTTTDSDFVFSDNVDFHPTDVLMDADGSLLVFDTGGWYKLCCPTSQLWKPDVLGGIYRVRKIGEKGPTDPRGKRINWSKQTADQLWDLFADNRSAVRERASRHFAGLKDSPSMKQFIGNLLHRSPLDRVPDNPSKHLIDRTPAETVAALGRVWALSQIDTPDARKLIREHFLTFGSEPVQHAAMVSISLHRDAEATPELARRVGFDKSPANRRIAAEALGRVGGRNGALYVLGAATKAEDRVLQHSIVYALIESNERELVRGSYGLQSDYPKVVAAALISLDQMPSGDIKAADVIPHLGAADTTLRNAAGWIVRRHPDWGGDVAQWLSQQLKQLAGIAHPPALTVENAGLEDLFVLFASDPAVQRLLADAITQSNTSTTERTLALRVMARSRLQGPPAIWIAAISNAVASGDGKQLSLALAAARRFPIASASNSKLAQSLAGIADSGKYPLDERINALAIVVGKRPKLSDSEFDLLIHSLSGESPVPIRSTAADTISKSHLTPTQFAKLCDAVQAAGPLELNRLFKPFDQTTDDATAKKLLASLRKSPSLPSLRIDLLRQALAKYGPDVKKDLDQLEALVNVDAAAQRKHIEELLPLVAKGDIRRGHAVFYSAKATCSSCHRLGYAGGTTGPDLTHVGKTRTERDILESILYPSLSFVRSYEPMLITTTEGKQINGVIHDENAKEYVIATGPDQEVRLARDNVDQIEPSKVSIMPAGLDKQLTPQELADLVTFLKNGAGQ
jgi:putative membrane-bound dehydrogenase-like protein